jgi:hypothetical protein
MIVNLKNINEVNCIIKKEGLEICIVSYGGSGTNELVNILEKNGYKCRTPIWDKLLCHCPDPINIDIPIIYIYRNIVDAFFSTKRRGYELWKINQQKLSNNLDTVFSDKNFFELMIKQFVKWKKSNLKNVLFINYKDCFNENIKIILQNFLNNNNLQYLPFIYKAPKTIYNINELDNRLKDLFNKNKEIVEETKS